MGVKLPRPRVQERGWNVALLALALALWLALGAATIQTVLQVRDVTCFDDSRAPVWPAEWRYYAKAITCYLAFVAGRLTPGLRFYAREIRALRKTNPAAAAAREHVPGKAAIAAQAGLMLLFGLFTLALAYEALGLYQLDFGAGSLHPITTYTRCAIAMDPVRATFVAASISYLLGHWLWWR